MILAGKKETVILEAEIDNFEKSVDLSMRMERLKDDEKEKIKKLWEAFIDQISDIIE